MVCSSRRLASLVACISQARAKPPISCISRAPTKPPMACTSLTLPCHSPSCLGLARTSRFSTPTCMRGECTRPSQWHNRPLQCTSPAFTPLFLRQCRVGISLFLRQCRVGILLDITSPFRRLVGINLFRGQPQRGIRTHLSVPIALVMRVRHLSCT
jgi:hypothetical protein